MSSDDQIRGISHLDHPLTPPISVRWEEKTGTEQLHHLYAILINGKWNDDTDDKLIHLYAQVKNGERNDVTEEQLDQLVEKGWNRKWSSEMKRKDVTEERPRLLSAKVTNREWSSKMKKLGDDLYRNIMDVEWEDVIKIYKEQKKEMIQTAGITRSKHTALHIAILNKQIDVVKELLENIDPVAIREMTDNRKENPLHLAVSMGQLETCKLLVKMDPELIGAKNVEGETPLFLAALHGENEAFNALHPKCPITRKEIKHAKARCKRNDGNTILHLSIRGEHFKLAYQIINWYPELINNFNKDGQTALHLLAQNPSAFRSRCCLGPVDNFIYSCLIVDLDKVVDSDQVVDIASPVPKNYQTCLDLLNLGKRVFKLIVTCARIWEYIYRKNDDRLPVTNTIPGERQETSNMDPIQDEMSPDSSKHCQREHIGDKTEPQMGPRTEEGSGDSTPQEGHEIQRASKMEKEDSTERPQYPSNYHVFLHFLRLTIVLFLFVIGLGHFHVRKIKAKKQKHKLTYQIMKKLVHSTELWVYGGTGSKPDTSESILSHSVEPDEDQDEIHQDVSASTSNNPPRLDGLEDGKKWKEMMEPIRKMNELVEKIVSGLQGKEVFVEAEKKWTDVFRLKMPKDSVKDDKGISPILVAAKMGILEIVEEVLSCYSLALYHEDSDKKNVLMLAAENGQKHVVELLCKKYSHVVSIYQKLDNKGNTAIHLAATFHKNRPWRFSSAAIQVQEDLKWYKFIVSSMRTNLLAHRNKEGKTAKEVFEETHEAIIKDAVQWPNSTAESCSVVAALIASVAYASAATVPGGDNQNNGIPILKGDASFDTFIIASLVALCFSVTSLTMFLSVLTSNYTIREFLYNLTTRLLLGLTSLFISIGAMLVSFCAGHFFNIGDRNRNTGSLVFAIISLPVSAYVLTQFRLLGLLIRLVKPTF